ncbi:unnamed protein product [Cyclocybe aegerita]|uniref:Uncharacterized protein n=1 Tax=Cyclocybe aegerita TaxID=1973307 RepID=A0A8S0XRQ3_CYCAE|nr:unnamed protein product [Cyclocybe aegerita]
MKFFVASLMTLLLSHALLVWAQDTTTDDMSFTIDPITTSVSDDFPLPSSADTTTSDTFTDDTTTTSTNTSSTITSTTATSPNFTTTPSPTTTTSRRPDAPATTVGVSTNAVLPTFIPRANGIVAGMLGGVLAAAVL